ncbi:hypothetical protein ACFFYR_23280 [Paraburkholderia dipogonis]|uniref:hypothetical protein n=1 Tax=Paraburkholderia dipogonis TaxID=1211383 RepID=UPI00141AF896|nr:hypothetical protein [Paraburkholderia dipogonis]
MDGSLILSVLTIVSSSGAVYAGIRADQRALRRELGDVKQDVKRAHTRIDQQLLRAVK